MIWSWRSPWQPGRGSPTSPAGCSRPTWCALDPPRSQAPEGRTTVTTAYYLGLDLGQAHETTALAVLERSDVPARSYAVRHLERWPPGTSYPNIVEQVARLVAILPAEPVLAVDVTAVGHPVVDLIRKAGLRCPLYAITVTARHDVGAGLDGPL